MKQQTRHLVFLIGLTALALALGVFAYGAIYRAEPARQKLDALRQRLFFFEPEALVEIELAAKGDTTRLVFNQDADDRSWRLVSPFAARADPEAAALLASALVQIEWQEQMPPTKDAPTRYGLDRPAVDLRFRLKSGEWHRLRLGQRAAFDDTDYLLIDDGETVFQSKFPLRWAVEKSAQELRDRAVFPFRARELVGLEIERPSRPGAEQRVRLTQKRGKWQIALPFTAPSDEAAVRDFLEEVLSAQAIRAVTDRVTPYDSARFGLSPPQLIVKVELSRHRRLEYRLGRVDEGQGAPRFHVRRMDTTTLWEIPESLMRTLDVDLATLRQKSLVAFEPRAVSQLELRLAGKRLELRREELPPDAPLERWTAEPAVSGLRGVTATKVQALLEAIQAVRWTRPAPADAVEPPADAVRLQGRDGQLLAEFDFWLSAEGLAMARSRQPDGVVQLDPEPFSDFISRAFELLAEAETPAGAATGETAHPGQKP